MIFDATVDKAEANADSRHWRRSPKEHTISRERPVVHVQRPSPDDAARVSIPSALQSPVDVVTDQADSRLCADVMA